MGTCPAARARGGGRQGGCGRRGAAPPRPWSRSLLPALGAVTSPSPRSPSPRSFPDSGTRRVQLVRRDGRDVSTLYGREGGGRVFFVFVNARTPPLPLATLLLTRLSIFTLQNPIPLALPPTRLPSDLAHAPSLAAQAAAAHARSACLARAAGLWLAAVQVAHVPWQSTAQAAVTNGSSGSPRQRPRSGAGIQSPLSHAGRDVSS